MNRASRLRGGDSDFITSFASPAIFEDLSEDWEILSRTASKIELKYVSGGNGGTDLLTFEKNQVVQTGLSGNRQKSVNVCINSPLIIFWRTSNCMSSFINY